MPHPLDDASLRIVRAEQHLSELRQMVAAFIERANYTIGVERKEGTDDINVSVKGNTRPPDEMSLPVSDCIHNLRAALDYLVYELAFLDSGQRQEGTQFLIEDASKTFVERSRRYMKGINAAHIAAIESLQPYKGVEWTKTIRNISNQDKHRYVLIVANSLSTALRLQHGKPGSFEGRPGLIFKAVGPRGNDVYVEGNVASRILLDYGSTPIVETLEKLKIEVAATIDAFKPEFKV